MKGLLVSLLLCSLSFASLAKDGEFSEFVKDNSVFYENQDGTASASLSPMNNVSTSSLIAPCCNN